MGMQDDIVFACAPERIRFDTSLRPFTGKINIIQINAKPVGGGEADDLDIGSGQPRHRQAQCAFPDNFFAGTYAIGSGNFGGCATFKPCKEVRQYVPECFDGR